MKENLDINCLLFIIEAFVDHYIKFVVKIITKIISIRGVNDTMREPWVKVLVDLEIVDQNF